MAKRDWHPTDEGFVEAAIAACEKVGVAVGDITFETTPRGARRLNVWWHTPYRTTAGWSLAIRGMSAARCERLLMDAIEQRTVPQTLDCHAAAQRACRKMAVTLCEATPLPDFGVRVVWQYASGERVTAHWCVGHVTEQEFERGMREAIRDGG